jgi:ribonuclease HI
MLEKSKIPSKIQFLQNNVGRNPNIMHTCLEIALKKKADFIIFQEPYIGNNNNQEYTISHLSFYCFLPEFKNIRSRVAIFARKKSRFQASSRFDIISSNDILILNIYDKEKKLEDFQLINIYNEKSLEENMNEYTIERELINIIPEKLSIICGDFNAHHSMWNSQIERPLRASKLVDWILEHNLNLLNEMDLETFHRSNCENPSIIDLTFISEKMNEKIMNWFIDSEESSGSNHELIQFTIELNQEELIENPLLQNQFNFQKAQWEDLHKELDILKNLEQYKFEKIPEQSNLEMIKIILESNAIKLRNLILKAIENNIPKKKNSEFSKPWWNDDINHKRREMTKYRNIWKRNKDEISLKAYKEKRNDYFSIIKKAKLNCWNSFLENAQGKEIFKAHKYTKMKRIEKIPILEYEYNNNHIKAVTFEEKCEAFMNILFQKPPNTNETINLEEYSELNQWEYPRISEMELEENIFSFSIKKAAGPDSIGFLIIQKIYPILKNEFLELYTNLIEIGYHPKCWREGIGVILAKPNRKASNPKSYRMISLLNCLGKISEKIIANRLSFLASKHDSRENSLLYHDQLGGRKQYSAIDAVMSLIHDIQINKNEKLVTSILFMDIKGAFDHVSANRLIKICIELGLPKNLIYWIKDFLLERSINLSFDGEFRGMKAIEIGIPQGSPISPILFLIYIKSLFKNNENIENIRIPSYIDDIGLVAKSKTTKGNCQKLEIAMKELLNRQNENTIQFDMMKTELIHFFPNSDENERIIEFELELGSESKNIQIKPKNEVRYLGIFLDSKLNFKYHVNKKINAAESALNNIIRLSNTEKGLSFQAMRQLYIACISSIADFGIQIWWKINKNQKSIIKKYQKLQNRALRKILGVFKTSPTQAMELEASLSPPEIRFSKLCQNYAIRIFQMKDSHCIRKRISSSYPPFNNGIELDWNKYLDWNSNIPNNSNKKYPSQLFRICSLVKDHMNSLKIEEINHDILAPWNKNLNSLINIQISEKSKEEQLIIHNEKKNQIDFSKSMIIYTDGSKIDSKINLGAGIAYSDDNRIYYQESYNLGSNLEVFDAELFAIYKAFILIQKKISRNSNIQEYWIFSDSKAAIQRIQRNRIHAGQYIIDKIRNIVQKIDLNKIKINIEWVPSHMNIRGNELADLAAKNGADLNHSNEKFVSIAFLKRKIKENCLNEWKLNWNSYISNKNDHNHYKQFKMTPKWKTNPLKLNKKDFSTIIQLKLGHGYFKSYLFNININESNKCYTCKTKENPAHLILYCKNYNDIRNHLKKKYDLNGLNLNLNQIFNTKKGMKFLIEYIQETNIATREWRLNRDLIELEENEEEEEEEEI